MTTQQNRKFTLITCILISCLYTWFVIPKTRPLNYAPIFIGPGSFDQRWYLALGHNLESSGTFSLHYDEHYVRLFETHRKHYSSFLPGDNLALLDDAFSGSKNDSRQTTDRPFLYPLLLALSFKLFGFTFQTARILNVVIFIAFVILFLFTLRRVSNWRIALFSLSLFTLVPLTSESILMITTEVLAFFCITLFMYIAYQFTHSPTITNSYWLGITTGLLLWCRLNFLLFIPFVVLLTILTLKKRSLFFLKSLSFSSGLSIFVLPFLLWNLKITNQWQLILGEQSARSLPLGHTEGYLKGHHPVFALNDELLKFTRIQGIQIDTPTKAALAYKALFRDMIQRPGFFSRLAPLFLRRCRGLYENYGWIGLLLLALALFGGLRARTPCHHFWALIPLTLLMQSVLIFPAKGRYLLPALPILAFFAAQGLTQGLHFLNKFKGRFLRLNREVQLTHQ